MWISSNALALCLAVVLGGAAACKGKPDAAKAPAASPAAAPVAIAAATAPSATSPSTQPAAVPQPLPMAAAPDLAALAFFRAQIEACNAWNVKVGNTKPGEKFFDGTDNDPTRKVKVVERPAPGRFVVEDADGTRLLIDLAGQRITATKGPGAALPVRYKFCSEKVFVGTSD